MFQRLARFWRHSAHARRDDRELARWQDGSLRLPSRLPLRVWLVAIALFTGAYGFMWSVVHVRADTEPCLTRLVDPLFGVISYNRAWYYVTHDVYEVVTVLVVIALFLQALRGEHRPLVRWGTGLAIQALLRSTTISLLPICRHNIEPGTIALDKIPMLDLGFVQIPWRVWASNDLIFSGHVGEFLLLFWATRTWPKSVRWGLVVFQVFQAYGLIATRGHYTIDILLAVPCAFFADSIAVELLDRLARPLRNPAPERAGA
jgi:hypothetical protein